MWWLTAAADTGRCERDHEKRLQTILLEENGRRHSPCVLISALGVYLLCKTVKGSLTIGRHPMRDPHMVNAGTAVPTSICDEVNFRRLRRSYVSLRGVKQDVHQLGRDVRVRPLADVHR